MFKKEEKKPYEFKEIGEEKMRIYLKSNNDSSSVVIDLDTEDKEAVKALAEVIYRKWLKKIS